MSKFDDMDLFDKIVLPTRWLFGRSKRKAIRALGEVLIAPMLPWAVIVTVVLLIVAVVGLTAESLYEWWENV